MILDIFYPLPFHFLRRGIMWLCALRKAAKPSREAARQPPPKNQEVQFGALCLKMREPFLRGIPDAPRHYFSGEKEAGCGIRTRPRAEEIRYEKKSNIFLWINIFGSVL